MRCDFFSLITFGIISLFAGSVSAQNIATVGSIPINNQNYALLQQCFFSSGVNEVCESNFAALSQFPSATDLSTAISGVTSTVNSALTGINAELSHLRTEAFSGTALAASLTPILPSDGNQNHVNFSAATFNGTQAFSANYAHVEGPYDFTAGAAFSRNYSLAKIGVGFSW